MTRSRIYRLMGWSFFWVTAAPVLLSVVPRAVADEPRADGPESQAGKHRHTPIPVDLKGERVPIKTGLKKVLEPMALTYVVKDGVLTIKTEPPKGSKKS